MKLRLPANYLDLKLRHLQVLETTDDPIKRVSSVTGKSVDELRSMPHPLIIEANNHITQLQKREEAVHLKTITLNGVEYGFVPDWEEFTLGEWVDMEQHTKDFWANAHKAMALLYRPIERKMGDVYTIKPYTAKEDPEPFLDMPAPLVAGALLFFWSTELELLNVLASSLIRKTREAMNLVQSGGGTPSSSNWRERMFSRWTKRRNSASATPLHTSPTLKTSPSSVTK